MGTMTSANDYEQLELQQPYSRSNMRWDASDDELDNDNSSARLFERSRIKALAGQGWALAPLPWGWGCARSGW